MTSLELIVSQDPAGETSHVIVADGVVVDTLVAVTADLDVIRITPEEPWTGLTSLVIRTEASPSWVGWREIEVQGLVTGEVPAAAPDVIFVGGPVLTMSSLGTVEAVAVTDDLISAVGTEADVLATAGAETEVVELEGRALMPGFVDPHTHILNDAGRLDLDTLGGQQLALDNGITTLANLFTTPEFLEEMRGYERGGELRARISLYLIASDNCGVLQDDWWASEAPTRHPGEFLRIGGIKLFLDGGTCGPWAVTEEIQPGTGTAEPFLSTDDIIPILDAAGDLGHQVVIHSIGGRSQPDRP